MITTEIMAKLQLFHLYVKHWGGEKTLLSGLEDCENIKRGVMDGVSVVGCQLAKTLPRKKCSLHMDGDGQMGRKGGCLCKVLKSQAIFKSDFS